MGTCCSTVSKDDDKNSFDATVPQGRRNSSPHSTGTALNSSGSEVSKGRRRTPPTLPSSIIRDEELKGSGGFGVQWKYLIETRQDGDHEAFIAHSIVPNGAAERCGVEEGTQLLALDGVAPTRDSLERKFHEAEAAGCCDISFIPSFSMDEVRTHNTAESAWVVLNRKVYDITPFLESHPGGKQILLRYAGRNATAPFNRLHSKTAKLSVGDYFIGNCHPNVK